jgi:N6-adenosine-specific RNA methylase IME4
VPELIDAAKRGEIAPSAAAEIAALPAAEQKRLIEAADPKVFASVAKERRAEKQAGKRTSREDREQILAQKQLALPKKRYGVILADPEWRFEPYSRATGLDRAADNHYPTSSLDVIKSRDVGSIAADDCVLFLWATAPMLPQALEVMTAWGFAYKTHAIWRKAEHVSGRHQHGGLVLGTGYWFRNGHELLLVGTRGNVPAPAQGTQRASMFDAPPRQHSAKPVEAYDLIEFYFPNLPKIELNARSKREGWDAWGLEAPEANAAGVPAEQPAGVDPVRMQGSAVPAGDTADSIQGVAAGAAEPSVNPIDGDGPGEVATHAAPPPDAPDLNQIIRDGYAADMPLDQLAALTGLPKNAVKQRAKRMGLGSRDRQKRMASDYARGQHARGDFRPATEGGP